MILFRGYGVLNQNGLLSLVSLSQTHAVGPAFLFLGGPRITPPLRFASLRIQNPNSKYSKSLDSWLDHPAAWHGAAWNNASLPARPACIFFSLLFSSAFLSSTKRDDPHTTWSRQGKALRLLYFFIYLLYLFYFPGRVKA